MFIAKYNNEVIGVVSLWVNDLKSRQDLFPWMATLYVKKDYRNKGVGKMLQQISIEYARQKNYNYLYLITEHNERPIMKKSATKIVHLIPNSELEVLQGYYHGDISINHADDYVERVKRLVR